MNWAEWMKGICHVSSRGRRFSPSLHGDRCLKLSSRRRSPSRNLGEHRLVRPSGTTSRGTAFLYLVGARAVSQLLNFLPYVYEKKYICTGSCELLERVFGCYARDKHGIFAKHYSDRKVHFTIDFYVATVVVAYSIP